MNQLTPEEQSKDEFFSRLGDLSKEMVASHGKDFSMGALILAARWIAEGKLGASELRNEPVN
ncbi:MAG: hypothetical protein KF914_03015 [Rhizobiaceae bacterium]|nr:hypothetical protein [Rhizobiaceae bacterium]